MENETMKAFMMVIIKKVWSRVFAIPVLNVRILHEGVSGLR